MDVSRKPTIGKLDGLAVLRFVMSSIALLICVILPGGCKSTVGSGRAMPKVYAPQKTTITPVTRPQTGMTPLRQIDGPAQWHPDPGYEFSRRWDYIVIHHSATTSGDAKSIDRLHRNQDFDGIGYHFVINNGTHQRDGLIEVGYRWKNQQHGAHCRVDPSDDNYWNEHGIGICLIGNFEHRAPSRQQMSELYRLVGYLMQQYNIPADKVIAHRDVKATRCPGLHFPWSAFTRQLRHIENRGTALLKSRQSGTL